MKNAEALETSRDLFISRLRPCPPKLNSILKVLNLIPPKMRLPDLQKRIAKLGASPKGITQLERYVYVHKLLNETLKGTSDEFQQLVWEAGREGLPEDTKKFIRKFFLQGSPETTRNRILTELLDGDDDVLDDIYLASIDGGLREYTFITDAQDKLRKIIDMAQGRGSWLRFLYPLQTSGTITVNGDGIVKIAHDRFAAAVADVDASLIRECQNCERIFWAGRRDKNSCSQACAHILRNRRYRERYRQGFYQGANLTEKEKARTKQGRSKPRPSGGKSIIHTRLSSAEQLNRLRRKR